MSVKYFKTKTVHIVSGSSKWGTPKVILSIMYLKVHI
jgi:hypothetical protein